MFLFICQDETKLSASLSGSTEEARESLKRKLSVELVANRADISRSTLAAAEHDFSTPCRVSYLQVLKAMGLEKDFLIKTEQGEKKAASSPVRWFSILAGCR